MGRTYRAYRYEVSREKVREYALATGAGAASGDATGPTTAPPTFAACFTLMRAGHVFSDPELGASPNLVHGSQAYEFHRPVRVGDVLSCTPRIAAIVNRARMDLLTLEVVCVDAGTGQPVVTGTSTLVFLPDPA